MIRNSFGFMCGLSLGIQVFVEVLRVLHLEKQKTLGKDDNFLYSSIRYFLNDIVSYILDHVNAPLTILYVQARCLCE